jgi:hypothetical protein
MQKIDLKGRTLQGLSKKIQRIRFSKNNLCRNISDYTHWMVPMENEPLTGNPWAQPS